MLLYSKLNFLFLVWIKDENSNELEQHFRKKISTHNINHLFIAKSVAKRCHKKKKKNKSTTTGGIDIKETPGNLSSNETSQFSEACDPKLSQEVEMCSHVSG